MTLFLKLSININALKSQLYITMRRKKHPVTSYPAAKHPEHRKFAITIMREKLADLFIVQHERRL